jgi:transcriptional regulator with XRE-family HTH domain
MRTIKFLRIEAGLTQREMAEAMGISQPAFSNWENGKGTMTEARQRLALAVLELEGLPLASLERPVRRR